MLLILYILLQKSGRKTFNKIKLYILLILFILIINWESSGSVLGFWSLGGGRRSPAVTCWASDHWVAGAVVQR